MRLLAAIHTNIKFQFRNYLYYAYFIVCMLYVALLYWIPFHWKEQTAMFLLFTDCSFLGSFFIGGIVLLEKEQGIYDHLFVTPLKISEVIWSKVISLGILSVVSGLFIFLLSFGFSLQIFSLAIGIALNSVFASLLGLIFAVRVKSINQYLMISPLFATVLFLPVLEVMHFYESPLFLLIPGKAGLLLMEGAFHPLSSADWLYALCMFCVYIYLAYRLAYRAFYQHIILNIGG